LLASGFGAGAAARWQLLFLLSFGSAGGLGGSRLCPEKVRYRFPLEAGCGWFDIRAQAHQMSFRTTRSSTSYQFEFIPAVKKISPAERHVLLTLLPCFFFASLIRPFGYTKSKVGNSCFTPRLRRSISVLAVLVISTVHALANAFMTWAA